MIAREVSDSYLYHRLAKAYSWTPRQTDEDVDEVTLFEMVRFIEAEEEKEKLGRENEMKKRRG